MGSLKVFVRGFPWIMDWLSRLSSERLKWFFNANLTDKRFFQEKLPKRPVEGIGIIPNLFHVRKTPFGKRLLLRKEESSSIFLPSLVNFTKRRNPWKQVTSNETRRTNNKTYFCGSFGSFFFFFFEAFGFRAGGALGFIVLLLRFGESFPMYGSGDGRLKVLLLACKWRRKSFKLTSSVTTRRRISSSWRKTEKVL